MCHIAQIYKKEDCEGLLVMTEKVLMSIYMYSYLFIYKKEDKGHLVVIHVAQLSEHCWLKLVTLACTM